MASAEAMNDTDTGPSSSTYVAPDGTIKPLLPRNVNINQFYPDVPFNSPKERSQAKLGEFVDAPSYQLAITDGEGTEDGSEQNAPRNNSNNGREDGTSANCDQAAGENLENDGLFSTQVDEETLESAKKRQQEQNHGGALFDPENWEVIRESTTMAQLLDSKLQKHSNDALSLHAAGQYRAAITQYNKAIMLQPQSTDYYVKRAEAFLQLADFQSAILNYKRACVLQPENFEYYSRLAFIYFFYGQCLFDQKLFPEALEAFSRAAEMRPEVIGYHTRSIACLAALQRHGECLALVNKRLETEQDNADLYVMRARLHQLFRNTTLCYYDVKDALTLAPQHPEALQLMKDLENKAEGMKQQAVHLQLMGRHRDAMQKVSIAIETNPSVPDFHILRGALQRKLGDFNAAIDDYLLALDKTDHDEEHPVYIQSQRQLLLTYNDFAIECFSKGFYEEAIILLNKAIKGEKNEKGLYINRGDCFYKEGELQFAVADYQQSLEMDPSDTSVRSRIAVIHNDYGLLEYGDKKYKEADARFTLAIQQNPRVAEYYISRARVRHLMESVGPSRQDILLGLLLAPNNPEVLSVLARIFPGKSVKDVLASPAAFRAKQALQHLVSTASPIKLQPLDDGGEAESDENQATLMTPQGAEGLPGETKEPQRQSSALSERIPHLQTCMKEHEFNIKVAKEKQMINQRVKDALHGRGTLDSHLTGVKIASLPNPPLKPKKKKVPTATLR